MGDLVCTPDGRFVPPAEAKVSIFDRSFLFGDSVYETLRTYGGKPFALTRHLDRMERSMERLAMRNAIPRTEVERRIAEAHAKSGNAESYLRVVVSRGVGSFGLGPGIDNPGETWIIARPYEPPPEKPYTIVIAKVVRNPREGLDPAIKSGNYLNSIQAMIEARRAGADDAVMLNAAGNATEATTATIWMVSGGTIVTPPVSAGILEGITRHYLLDAAREAGLPCEERDFGPDALRRADEVFITSTLKEVLPVAAVDGIPKPLGPVTTRARALLSARIRRALAEET